MRRANMKKKKYKKKNIIFSATRRDNATFIDTYHRAIKIGGHKMKMTLLSVYCNRAVRTIHDQCTCTGALARVRMYAARNTRRDVFASAVDRGASTVEPAQVRLSFRFPRASSATRKRRIGKHVRSPFTSPQFPKFTATTGPTWRSFGHVLRSKWQQRCNIL